MGTSGILWACTGIVCNEPIFKKVLHVSYMNETQVSQIVILVLWHRSLYQPRAAPYKYDHGIQTNIHGFLVDWSLSWFARLMYHGSSPIYSKILRLTLWNTLMLSPQSDGTSENLKPLRWNGLLARKGRSKVDFSLGCRAVLSKVITSLEESWWKSSLWCLGTLAACWVLDRLREQKISAYWFS